ncbi:MAG: TlpA family protein disulfide reductase [Chloroflexi bacterium]|nr:TlpA family protein disulfide reductase [Chloroflexota bacterium]
MVQLRFERTILLATLTALGITWILFSREEVLQPRTVALTEAPIVGHLAPDFALPTPLGKTVSLTDFVDRDGDAGRPVVLNYWASWCGPCRMETPEFQNASLKYKNQAAILGINQGEDAQTVTEFGLSFGLTYPLLVDADSAVNQMYGVAGLPTTIFIDRKGVVREVFVGILNQAVLEDRLDRLLEEG